MSFLDFTGLISDDQLEGLRELNLERAASGQQLITLLDVLADDSVLEGTGVTTTSAEAEATLNEFTSISDAAAGLSEVEGRFTDQTTNEILQGIAQADIEGATIADLTEAYIDGQTNAQISVVETGTFNPNKGETLGELDISSLPDYGMGSVVLAPDGVGVIRGGKYINPSETNMSGSERNDIFSQAERNTKLLLADQLLKEEGIPIAETLGLKQPGDKGYDGDDRERISEAEFAISQLQLQNTNIDQYRYEQKQNEGPDPVPTGGIGSVQQDANGNWFAVKQIEGSNALGRDYSIDPKDNSAGPTFGKNVSKDIEEMFPNEVAAAGGSSDFEGSIKDIFKDTDVDSLGYDPVTGTYSKPVVTAPVETDIAQPGDLDIPEVTTEVLPFTPVGGPGTFDPGSLPAAAGDDYTPTSDQLTAQLEEAGLDDLRTDVSDVDFSTTATGDDFDIGAAMNTYDATEGTSFSDLEPRFIYDDTAPSITPERLAELESYVETLQRQQGIYTADDLDAAGFSASEIAAFEQGLPATGLTEAQIAENLETYGSLAEAPGTIQKYANMLEFVKGNPDLTLAETAAGLGYSGIGGFLEELALRTQGTGKMADDALSILGSYNLDQYEVIDPATGELVTVDLDNKVQEKVDVTFASEGLSGIVDYLNEKSNGAFALQSDEYKQAVINGMPDPNNTGFTMDGRRITDPSLWMADTAIQELGGLGIDVAALALNPVVGVPLALQQNVAEAGAAASNDVSAEMDALRNTAFKDLSDEDFNELKEAAKTQGFYTSGVAGGVVDTLSAALALGAPKILVKALPGVLTRVAGILGSEFVAGGSEQAGVNQAIISAMKAEGLNPEDYGVDLLNGTFNAAWSEMFGATGAAGGSVLLGNAAGNVDVGASTEGSSLPAGAGQGQDNNPNVGPDLIASQGLNTIESNEVTDSNNVVYLVDTAVDANGNTSVTVTNKTTNTSKTTNVANGNTNVVSVGSDTSVLVDSTNTNNSNTVNVSTLSPGSSVTIGGGENLLNGDDDTEVLKATGTDDVSSAYDPNTVYRRNNISYLGDPSNGVLADGNVNGTVYKDGQIVFGTGEAEGTNDVSDVTIGGGESLLSGGDDMDTSELTTVYHATKGEPFTQFDPTKGDSYYSNMGAFGPGFYGSLDTTYPSDYVGGEGSLMSAEIDTSNMLDAKNNKELTLDQVNGLVDSLSSRTDSEGNNLNVEWNGGTGNITVSYVRKSSFAGESVADRTVTRVIDTTNPTEVFQNVNLISENIKNPLATDDQGLVLESEQDGDTQNLKSIFTDAGFTGVLGVADTGAGQSGDPNSVVVFDESLIGDLNIVIDQDTIPTSEADILKATGTDDAVAGSNVVNNVDVSGTGITGVIQGGGTNTGSSDANLTLVGDSSVNTNGDLTITTVTDANGNATVSTTNNVTGENTITNVVVGDSTSVTNGNTTVDINAETNGTTTQATDNKVTTVEDGSSTTEGDSTVNTGVGVVTTVEEPDYLPGDTDVTVPPIDTVFVPETEFTPGGGDDDDDTTEDPVGEQTPGYTSGIAGLSGARPTVAPYYQPQQTGQYSFYVPQPGVDQTVPAGPVMSDPTSYLAPTANPQYGYGYIAPNAELEYLRRLAEIQGTGAEKLPSENLMDGS